MAKRKKRSFKNIINTSRYQLMKTNRNELRSMYSTLSKKVSKLVNQFEKNKRAGDLPDELRRFKTNSNKMSNADLVTAIGDYSNFFLTNRYRSYAEYKRQYNEGKQRYKDLIGKSRVSNAEYEDYRRYMKDMYERDKANWPSEYDDAMDIYVMSRRLNLDPRQFKDNLSKWQKRLEKMDAMLDAGTLELVRGKGLDIEEYSNVGKVASWLKYDKKKK